MNEDLQVLREYVESLGLNNKTVFSIDDILDLRDALHDGDELGLATYVENLKGPQQLSELIFDTLYEGNENV